MIVHSGHQGPKEIGAALIFSIGLLIRKEWRRCSSRFWLLWRQFNDLADEGKAPFL
jgi:hypothetical protein